MILRAAGTLGSGKITKNTTRMRFLQDNFHIFYWKHEQNAVVLGNFRKFYILLIYTSHCASRYANFINILCTIAKNQNIVEIFFKNFHIFV